MTLPPWVWFHQRRSQPGSPRDGGFSSRSKIIFTCAIHLWGWMMELKGSWPNIFLGDCISCILLHPQRTSFFKPKRSALNASSFTLGFFKLRVSIFALRFVPFTLRSAVFTLRFVVFTLKLCLSHWEVLSSYWDSSWCWGLPFRCFHLPLCRLLIFQCLLHMHIVSPVMYLDKLTPEWLFGVERKI